MHVDLDVVSFRNPAQIIDATFHIMDGFFVVHTCNGLLHEVAFEAKVPLS